MFKRHRVTVVVPAYNESTLILGVVDTIPAWVDRIIVVDDASTDDTAEKLATAQNTLGDRLRMVHHERNASVGAAIVSGYEAALEEVDSAGAGFVAVKAGDAQMDPDKLPQLLMPLVRNQADYTKGNRIFSGEAWKIMPPLPLPRQRGAVSADQDLESLDLSLLQPHARPGLPTSAAIERTSDAHGNLGRTRPGSSLFRHLVRTLSAIFCRSPWPRLARPSDVTARPTGPIARRSS